MEKRLGTITLGVNDLARARRFYEEGLGWSRDGGEDDIAFYQLGGIVLGLYERPKLARDAGVADDGAGFRAVTIAYCARSREEVDRVLEAAQRAGGALRVQARDTFWGGYAGYFADPDEHLWEVAYNPHLTITDRGEHLMKSLERR
ncbi:MAG TPA: VOC family protein [Polyangiaceae bacterium]|nr:VOC family protein [Polyangiaceae bacterium]